MVPQRVQSQGAQELCVLEGLRGTSGCDGVQLLQLQLLLTGANTACEGRRRPLANTNPATIAGLTDHVWSLREWLTFPAVQRK